MEKDTSKSTILVISMGFLLIYLVFDIGWAVKISLIIGIIGIVSVRMSKIIEVIWMQIAKILGYIVPNILLTTVFYLFLFPLSLLSKISGKDPLKLSGSYKSYFVDINTEPGKKSFEKMW